jgi:hypothetical protein
MTWAFAAPATGPALAAPPAAGQPDFGPNVFVFTPDTPQIQAAVDTVAAQQVPSQFGTQRFTLLFEPGVYGTVALRYTNRAWRATRCRIRRSPKLYTQSLFGVF